MSNTPTGLLETKQSFPHNHQKNLDYKANSITSSKFTDWQKDFMYKSSYAHFHSRVNS